MAELRRVMEEPGPRARVHRAVASRARARIRQQYQQALDVLDVDEPGAFAARYNESKAMSR